MENKVIGIDLQVADAVKKAKELDSSVNHLGQTFADLYGGIQPLSGRMGELEDRMYELALAGETNTQEYKELSAQVAKYKKVIIDTDLAVDAMASTTSQKLGGALEFASGGFTAIQGASMAFGVESQALEESLLKVQSAMAITQGIDAMREGYKSVSAIMGGFATNLAKTALGQKILTATQWLGTVAMKALNAVMNMNPVFLLVTGIVALTGAIIYFTGETKKAEEANNAINRTYEKTNTLLDETAKKLKRNGDQKLKEMQIAGKSEKELHEQRIKNLDNEEKLRKISSTVEKETIKEKKKQYRQALKEGNEELAKTIKDEIAQSRTRYNELNGQHLDYINNKKNEDLEYNAKLEEQRIQDLADQKAKNKEAYDNYKSYKAEQLQIARQIEDAIFANKFDNEEKAQEANRVAFERFREDTLANTRLTEEQKNILIEQEQLQAQQRRNEISRQYQLEFEDAIASADAERALVKEETELEALRTFEQKKTEIQTEHENTRFEQFSIDLEKKTQASNDYLNTASNALQTLDDLNSLLTDNAVKKAGANEAAAERARKKGFERSKKIQLTMAVIQGVQGVMSAFTAGSSMGPAGVVMGPLMAALAAVTAGINIAKIKATTYEGGGGASVSSGGGGGVPNPASFNVVGNSGTNQLAETLGAQNKEPMKAYVVGEDVTTQQSLDRNKVGNATL